MAWEVRVAAAWLVLALWAALGPSRGSPPPTAPAPITQQHLSTTHGKCPSRCKCAVMTSPKSGRRLPTVDCAFAVTQAEVQAEVLADIPPSAQALILRGNALRELPQLQPSSSLLELDLSGNRIKALGRAKAFSELSKLQELSLAKNQLSTLFSGAFQGLPDLRSLSVCENRVAYIEDGALGELPRLSRLDLSHNLLGSVYADWFRGLASLTNLSLAHNRVHHLPAGLFRGAPRLQMLDLSGNRLAAVDADAFDSLPALAMLLLNDNLLSSPPSAALATLLQLQELRLNGNPLQRLPPRSFSELPHLQRLHLEHLPELRLVENQAFHSLPQLKELHLHHNSRLAFLDPKALSGTPGLQRLLLHDDALRAVAVRLVEGLPHGTLITLHGNPLLCDCNVRWLRNLLQAQDNTKPSANISSLLIEEGEHITCAAPPRARLKLVHDLGLQQVGKRCPPTLLDVTWGVDSPEEDIHSDSDQAPRIVERRVGDTLTLECRALGDPEPRLRWTLPRNASANEVRVRLAAPGSLMLRHLTTRDTGVYSCAAQNVMGVARVSWELTVRPLDLHLFAAASSATFVTLVWNGTQRYAFPRYEIRYSPTDGGETEDGESTVSTAWVSPFRRSYTVAPLVPATRYRFCLVFPDESIGSNGRQPHPQSHLDQWSLILACTEARTQDPSFLAQGISRPPATAALMVLGTILFLVTAAAISCAALAVLRRIRKRRRYLCPPHSHSHSATSTMIHQGIHHHTPHIPMDSLKSPLIGTGDVSSS